MKARQIQFAVLLVTIWLAGIPVIYLAFGATHSFRNPDVLTFQYLHKVFFTDFYLVTLRRTMALSAMVAVCSTFIGAALGLIVARIRLYGGRYWDIALMSPIFVSPFIGVIGWITLAGPQAGLLNSLLRGIGFPQMNVFSFTGGVFVMSVFFAPFCYALVRGVAERLDPALEEAAAISGAAMWATMRHVLLPLLWPSLLSSLVFAFVLATEMFSIPGLLLAPGGYRVLAYAIYVRTTQFPLDYSEAAAIGFLLLVITALGMIAYARLIRVQERYVTVSGRGMRTLPITQGTITRILASTACFVYVMVAVLLPLAVILLRSLLPFFSGSFNISDLTLANIIATLNDQSVKDALVNSLIVTFVSTVALIFLSLVIAISRVRHKNLISQLTSIVASLPLGVPGVLIGVGLLWAYIRTPLYATVWILILIMLARFLPILVRMFETALIQIDKNLEEAGAVSGANQWRITWHIRLPLLVSTVRSALIIATSQIFNELTASALLFTATSSVLPVVVFNYMFDGNYARAAACALLQVIILFILFGCISVAVKDRRNKHI